MKAGAVTWDVRHKLRTFGWVGNGTPEVTKASRKNANTGKTGILVKKVEGGSYAGKLKRE